MQEIVSTDQLYKKVEEQVNNGFKKYGYCSFYIASLNNKQVEIFANDVSIYAGTEANCKRNFKILLKELKKNNYYNLSKNKEYILIERKRKKSKK